MSDQFELPYEDYHPQHGEMVRCANCGRNNDYTSMTRVMDEEAQAFAEEIAQELIDDFQKDLKKMFKGNPFITIK